MKIIVLYLN